MKAVRNKNLFGILFAVLLALPLFNIAGRVIYTQSNKNAKDSYYGETINERELVNVNNTKLVSYEEYQFLNDYVTETIPNGLPVLSITIENLRNMSTDVPISANILRFYKYENDLYIEYRQDTTYVGGTNLRTNLVSLSFTYISRTSDSYLEYIPFFYETIYNNYSYLDNAFEYSVNQFIEDNNFGVLDFFSWFNGMFFNNNAKANMFIQFGNWYMNYALYLSLGYVLFLVLMWWINYIRKLLDKGMSFGEGSY